MHQKYYHKSITVNIDTYLSWNYIYLPLPGRGCFDVEADCARGAKGSQEEHGEAAGNGALQHLKANTG